MNLLLWFQVSVPSMVLVVSIKSNLIITYLVSVCSGIAVAAAYLMSWWDHCWTLAASVASADSDPRSDPLQVHATRCGGRFQAAEPQIYWPWSHLLLLLCLLHQVCLWGLSGHFHSQFTVSSHVIVHGITNTNCTRQICDMDHSSISPDLPVISYGLGLHQTSLGLVGFYTLCTR